MSRYPTTADLAAFRRTIERSTHGGGLRVAIFDDDLSRPGGAIDYERVRGIGYRSLPGGFTPEHVPTLARIDARREAAALRSRAFEGRYCDDCAEPVEDCPGCYSASPYLCGEALAYQERCYHVPFVEHSHSDPAPFIR